MNRSSLRTLATAFLLTLIIQGTAAGLMIAAFNTQSAMTPLKAPASARISENGDQYELSFFDRQFSLPRFPVKEVENFVNRYPIVLPKAVVLLAYGVDCLSNFLSERYQDFRR